MQAEQALARAQQLLAEDQPEAARGLLVELVSAHPAHEEGWLLLATVVQVDQAIDCLQRVLALNPNHARARKWLPLAQREQERLAALAALKAQPPEAEDEVPLTEPGDDERPVPRLGQYLLDFKFIKTDQLKAALVAQRRAKEQGETRRVGDLLLEQGAITEDRLNFAVREQRRGFFSQFQD
jgi:tetratricopeptide (TPR) repeat protein